MKLQPYHISAACSLTITLMRNKLEYKTFLLESGIFYTAILWFLTHSIMFISGVVVLHFVDKGLGNQTESGLPKDYEAQIAKMFVFTALSLTALVILKMVGPLSPGNEFE